MGGEWGEDGMIDTKASGPGLRSNLMHDDTGELLLSLWAVAAKDEIEEAANKANLRRMQDIDREEHRLAQEFAAQAVAEFRRIRARA
jgi:hypothetical protein